MAGIPDGIVLKRHRDLDGRRRDAWIRRALLALVGLVPLLALSNLFGQRPHLSRAAALPASLELYAPGHVRGGLLWEARFTVTAHRELKDAVLELDKGWLEGMTLNTIEPSPVARRLARRKARPRPRPCPRGQRHIVFMQFQVNPTNVGRRPQDVRLYDGSRPLVTIHRRITVFP